MNNNIIDGSWRDVEEKENKEVTSKYYEEDGVYYQSSDYKFNHEFVESYSGFAMFFIFSMFFVFITAMITLSILLK